MVLRFQLDAREERERERNVEKNNKKAKTYTQRRLSRKILAKYGQQAQAPGHQFLFEKEPRKALQFIFQLLLRSFSFRFGHPVVRCHACSPFAAPVLILLVVGALCEKHSLQERERDFIMMARLRRLFESELLRPPRAPNC